MYLSFKDFMLIVLKSIIVTSIIFGLGALGALDYHLGISYCNLMNIPKDLAFTMVSPGMAIEIGILLFVFEFAILFILVRRLKRFKAIDRFCDFISLEF
ncbi:MAG: hypothetical protein J5892_05180 [Bacilli bacterium]|nr:hypothetical protein [Bacilli bacterium]